MKKDLHPALHKDAKATCTTCASVFLIPSTVQTITVESCKNCNPVYTGKKLTTTRGGRIDRFKKRLEAKK